MKKTPVKNINFLFIIVFILNTWSLYPASSIHLDKTAIDFGELKFNQKASKTIIITNTGKSNLKIRKVRSSCKCITTELKKNKISPETNTNLKISIDTNGLHGQKTYNVFILSNDPDKEITVINIPVRIIPLLKPLINVFPAEILFGNLNRSKITSRLIVKNVGGNILTVNLKCESNGISFSENSFSVSSGKKKIIKVHYLKVKKLSSGTIRIISNSIKNNELDIPFKTGR